MYCTALMIHLDSTDFIAEENHILLSSHLISFYCTEYRTIILIHLIFSYFAENQILIHLPFIKASSPNLFTSLPRELNSLNKFYWYYCPQFYWYYCPQFYCHLYELNSTVFIISVHFNHILHTSDLHL